MTEYPTGSVNMILSPFRTHGTAKRPDIGILYSRQYHSVMAAITVIGHQLLITFAPPEAYAFANGERVNANGELAHQALRNRVRHAAIQMTNFSLTPWKMLELAFPEKLPGEEITIFGQPVGQTNLAYQTLPPAVYTTWLRVLLRSKELREDCVEIFRQGIDHLELPYLEAKPNVRNFGMEVNITNLAQLPSSRIFEVGPTQNVMGNQCLQAIIDVIKGKVPKVIMVIDFAEDTFYERLECHGEMVLVVALCAPHTQFIVALTEALLIPKMTKLVMLNTTGAFIPPLPNDAFEPEYIETLRIAETWLQQNDVNDIYMSGHVLVSKGFTIYGIYLDEIR